LRPRPGEANLWAVALVFVLLAALAVGTIAVLALKRADTLLAAREAPVLFEVDEAIEFVASALPEEVSARLSYEDVEALLGWHLVHLVDREGEVDIADDLAVADLTARAEADGRAISAADVRAVLAAEAAYLAAIGALGPDAET
jgi:hypothetical protein